MPAELKHLCWLPSTIKGQDIFNGVGVGREGSFEIPHKISYSYIERYDFLQYWIFKCSQIYKLVCIF